MSKYIIPPRYLIVLLSTLLLLSCNKKEDDSDTYSNYLESGSASLSVKGTYGVYSLDYHTELNYLDEMSHSRIQPQNGSQQYRIDILRFSDDLFSFFSANFILDKNYSIVEGWYSYQLYPNTDNKLIEIYTDRYIRNQSYVKFFKYNPTTGKLIFIFENEEQTDKQNYTVQGKVHVKVYQIETHNMK